MSKNTSEYRRAYYQKHKESLKAEQREYYKKNRDRIIEWHKNYRAEYGDLINADRRRRYKIKNSMQTS